MKYANPVNYNYSQSRTYVMKPYAFVVSFILLAISCSEKDEPKVEPVIMWSNPSEIAFGTLLSTTQLNATANVPGTFIYTPAIGVILDEGMDQELKVDFAPTDQSEFSSVSKTVSITVISGSNSMFNTDLFYGTITDVDNNVYKTITIGTQTWMAENLRTTKYRNGDDISHVTSNEDWKNLSTEAYCSYDNTTDMQEIATYGNLYNWFAVSDVRDLAPEGWHVATDADWQTLTTYLSEGVAGGKLKESSLLHWNSPNTNATNSSGFTALPSGRREYVDGSFINIGFNGFWWTSSAYNPDYSWYRQMNYDAAFVNPANFHKQYGFAVRCVKD